MEQKKEMVLYFINILSDKEFQKKVWINQEEFYLAFCYDETVNLLDDYQFFDDIEEKRIYFTNPESQAKLISFASMLLNDNEPSNLSDILTALPGIC